MSGKDVVQGTVWRMGAGLVDLGEGGWGPHVVFGPRVVSSEEWLSMSSSSSRF